MKIRGRTLNDDGAPGIAGVDDDGDGSIDEGDVADDDEDGQSDEDWYDPVVFYLSGSAVIERRAYPGTKTATARERAGFCGIRAGR